MKEVSTRLWSFTLPLQRPLPVNGQSVEERKGVLIEITDALGNTGWGEVIPLPGLHCERYEEAVQQTIEWARGRRTVSLFPSVQFGVEMAEHTYRSSASGKPVFPRPEVVEAVSVQALLSGNAEEVLQQAYQRLKEGYVAFKLKLGRQSLRADIDCVRQLRGEIGLDALLRLDPNRAWSPEDATDFIQGIQGWPYDYLEEPLKDSLLLPEWVEETGASVALDESIGGWGKGAQTPMSPGKGDPRLCCAKALVLKPHVLGYATQGWVDWAKQNQKQVVMSDCFGSGLSRLYLARWAASLPGSPVAGLDTGRWLAQDLTSACVVGGRISVCPSKQGETLLNKNLLTPL